MIDLYTWPTPNGHKIHIALEELGLPYRVHAVDIGAGEQFEPEFLRFSPNNKIPALVDPDGPDGQALSVFESGAILIYLAEKTGRLLAPSGGARYAALQWLMWQMGGQGPMLGQAHHFRIYAPERVDYAIQRYTQEARRLYAVLDARLAQAAYLAGDDYSIADIAAFPWCRSAADQGVDWADFPHAQAWFERVAQRPAVQRALTVLAERRKPLLDQQARDNLFGARQLRRK